MPLPLAIDLLKNKEPQGINIFLGVSHQGKEKQNFGDRQEEVDSQERCHMTLKTSQTILLEVEKLKLRQQWRTEPHLAQGNLAMYASCRCLTWMCPDRKDGFQGPWTSLLLFPLFNKPPFSAFHYYFLF